jgi:hypothetical protein
MYSKKFLYFIFSLLFLTSCDTNKIDSPKIDVKIDYYDKTDNRIFYLPENYSTVDIYVELDAKDNQAIQFKRVYTEYNNDLLKIQTTEGNDNYFITDDTGKAKGTISVKKTASSNQSVITENIKFYVQGHEQNATNVPIKISYPYIQSVSADTDIVPANNYNIAEIKATLFPSLNDIEVVFSTDLGTLNNTNSITDINGIATNIIRSNTEGTATINITTKSTLFPNAKSSFEVHFVEDTNKPHIEYITADRIIVPADSFEVAIIEVKISPPRDSLKVFFETNIGFLNHEYHYTQPDGRVYNAIKNNKPGVAYLDAWIENYPASKASLRITFTE